MAGGRHEYGKRDGLFCIFCLLCCLHLFQVRLLNLLCRIENAKNFMKILESVCIEGLYGKGEQGIRLILPKHRGVHN